MDTKQLNIEPDVTAPDGADVRVLCQTARGSMAHFTLAPGGISRAVAHHTIDEVWYFLSGRGRMWRRLGPAEEIVEVGPGLSLSIPVGTHFQFRTDGDAPLAAVAVAMPPWPDMEEAYPVDGPWAATV
jgi:mannose-6-phosphate isomerase-like protein (cupin superfamily)